MFERIISAVLGKLIDKGFVFLKALIGKWNGRIKANKRVNKKDKLIDEQVANQLAAAEAVYKQGGEVTEIQRNEIIRNAKLLRPTFGLRKRT